MREHGTKTTLVFLPANGEASWSLLSSLVSLLSGGTVQPETVQYCTVHLFQYPQGDRSGLRQPKR